MRGLGKYSKRGSGFIVGGVAGGAVVPPLLFAASDSQNNKSSAPTAIAMSVPLAFFVAAWSYPICVNFVPAYRDVVDKFTTTKIGVEVTSSVDEESQVQNGGVVGKENPGHQEIIDSEKKL